MTFSGTEYRIRFWTIKNVNFSRRANLAWELVEINEQPAMKKLC